MKVLVIIGSVRFADRYAWRRAEDTITEEIEQYQPDWCASGGAEGIDSLFKVIAARWGYSGLLRLLPPNWEGPLPSLSSEALSSKPFIEYLPREDILSIPAGKARWNAPGGYKERNIQVATAGTRVVAIRCHASLTYGSGWTVSYAERAGKDVRRVIL